MNTRYSKQGKGMRTNRGVGAYCRKLLARIVGRTADGQPVGLSYVEIAQMAKRKFHDSQVNEKHLACYAAAMRCQLIDIPAHRRKKR
jgi:hypothetical protein